MFIIGLAIVACQLTSTVQLYQSKTDFSLKDDVPFKKLAAGILVLLPGSYIMHVFCLLCIRPSSPHPPKSGPGAAYSYFDICQFESASWWQEYREYLEGGGLGCTSARA